ncbi:MAG: class I SAM-dependent methyltransferase [Phycisphaerales bacterium]|nr:class I SAM-dependent methyltransferase [Phycisphaerae bacterium]NNF43696.1 class I SAM-dependent methyltransferase [Phycisphaerales bacterium]NNM25466.1 class I SAM-dependent methyltransferase [Phycisphaerales bacterium]
MPPAIALWLDTRDPAVIRHGHALVERLGCVLRHDPPPPAPGCLLHLDDTGLSLRDASASHSPGIRGAPPTLDLRPGRGDGLRRQPLGRAIGRTGATVIDATAGLGRDAFMLAAMGHRVNAIERSPVLVQLLIEGWSHALAETPALASVLTRIELREGDARAMLPACVPAPDVVYLDPMYPPKRKASALAPMRVRLVRGLVGDDPDAEELLAIARRAARTRVVVKRPHHAPPLAEPVAGSVKSKLVRFDIYPPAPPNPTPA